MKVSLNEIVSLISDRVGQPFNIPLQEELKVIVNYKRADWIQKVIEKYPEQRKYFVKDISVELEPVDETECPVESDCTVLRTTFKIPKPVRSTYALFDYVGDVDKTDGYRYVMPEQLRYITKYSKYTKDRPSYFYVNGYVYIYNEPDLEYINIRGLWPDQRELHELKCGDEVCYTDDDQYDIPDDILNTMIQDILKNELKLLLAPEESEVTVTEPNKQQ